MKLRWLLGNFTEPDHGLTRREQMDLSWLAHTKHTCRRTFWLWTLVLLVLPGVLAFWVALPAVLGWLGLQGRDGPFLIGAAVIIIAFWVWSAWVYGRLYVKPVRRAMREHGVDVCVECGYELTGLDAGIERCPECGTGREDRAP